MPPLVVVRAACAALLLVDLGLFLFSLPVRYNRLLNLQFTPFSQADHLRWVDADAVRVALEQFGISPGSYAAWTVFSEVAFAFAFWFVAALVASQRKDSRWALLLGLGLFSFGTAAVPSMWALADVYPVLEPVVRCYFQFGWAVLGLLILLFPTGRPVSRWFWPVIGVWLVWQLAQGLQAESPLNPLRWPSPVTLLLMFTMATVLIGGQAYRYYRVSGPTERQQTKWAFFGLATAFTGDFALNLPYIVRTAMQQPVDFPPVYALVRLPLTYSLMLLLPTTIAIAILRYRLWDIDLIINRTLVYVPLTAITAGGYSAGISLTQRLFVSITGDRSDAAVVIVTLVFASLFTPVKNGLQGIVDKRFKEPAASLRSLLAVGEHTESAARWIDPRLVAGELLERSVLALGASGGACFLGRQGDEQLVHTVGNWDNQPEIVVPLEHDGLRLGALALGPRRNGLSYSAHERGVLQQSARSVAGSIAAVSRALREAATFQNSLPTTTAPETDRKDGTERIVSTGENQDSSAT